MVFFLLVSGMSAFSKWRSGSVFSNTGAAGYRDQRRSLHLLHLALTLLEGRCEGRDAILDRVRSRTCVGFGWEWHGFFIYHLFASFFLVMLKNIRAEDLCLGKRRSWTQIAPPVCFCWGYLVSQKRDNLSESYLPEFWTSIEDDLQKGRPSPRSGSQRENNTVDSMRMGCCLSIIIETRVRSTTFVDIYPQSFWQQLWGRDVWQKGGAPTRLSIIYLLTSTWMTWQPKYRPTMAVWAQRRLL